LNLEFIDGHADYYFNINVSFNTKTPLTPRIIQVSEAFGLGVSEEKTFTIYNNFRIAVSKGDIIFITGDSGGGKSLLMKELKRLLPLVSISIEDIQISPDELIIEELGSTLDEAVKLLSLVGLNDAFIFLRRYKELSDGQKYRYKLAKILAKSPDVIFIDEFCANLDRITAKVISYNLQKVCRNKNIILVTATTHSDIKEDLNPSVIVTKKFMNEYTIVYPDVVKKDISFVKDIVFSKGTIDDYKSLSKYHYKNTSLDFPYTNVVVGKYNREIVGVAVYSPPFLQTKGRTIKFENKYSLMTQKVCNDINTFFIRGSRYVISPKFRACGLGQKLFNESLKFLPTKKYIEVITVMGEFNPVFERCGCEKIEISEETDPPTIKLTQWLKDNGLNLDEIHNPKYWNLWINSLSDEHKTTLKLLTGKVMHHPKIGLSNKDGRRAEVVFQENRYKEVHWKEVLDEMIVNIPKLYSGNTIYYLKENPYYRELNKLEL